MPISIQRKIDAVIITISQSVSAISLNTQEQQEAGLKYYWIGNDNIDFSLPF